MKKLVISIIACSLFGLMQAQTNVLASDSIIIIEGNENGTGSSGGPLNTGNIAQYTNYKLVYWIHGLEGGVNSWLPVINALRDQSAYPVNRFPPRKVHSVNLEYKNYQGSDLLNAGIDYGNDLDNFVANDSTYNSLDRQKAFAVAHSLGGLMARSIRRANFHSQSNVHVPDLFSALATFGTPHGGAALSNNSDNGMVQYWVDNGCRAIGPAVIQGFIDDSDFFLGPLIPTSIVNTFSNITCDGLNKIALPILVNAFQKPITKTIAKGHHVLDTLKQVALQDTIKTVTFYSVEQEPVLWRTIGSMTEGIQHSGPTGSLMAKPFSMNNDDALPTDVLNMINDYIMKKNMWHTIARNKAVGAFFPWPNVHFLNQSQEAREKAQLYNNAAHWLGTANTAWKRLIGARRDSFYLDGYQCDCLIDLGGTNGYAFQSTIVSNPGDCGDPNAINCRITPRILHLLVEERSDGVVTASSQQAYPGVFRKHRMARTNHMQQRNSMETKRALKDLFKGSFGTVFKLEEQ